MTREIRRTPDGIRVSLHDGEARVLRALAAELLELLADDGPAARGPVLARLLPDGYRDDPAAAAELREMTEPDLRAGKRAAARTLLETARDGGPLLLDEEAAEQWLAAVNDLRLALGTSLAVTEDDDTPDPDEEPERALYLALGYLQELLVDALAAGLR